MEYAQFLSDARDIDRNLKRIVEFFGPQTSLADAANGEAKKHLSELVARRRAETVKGTGRPVSNRTVNVDVIDCFTRFVKYARSAWRLKKAIQAPEYSELRLPETQERDRALTQSEAEALVSAIRPDYLPLFVLARLTGIRLSALVSLTWPQVDFDGRRIRIKVKDRNAKDRWHNVPLTDPAIAVLAGERGRHETAVFTYVSQRGRLKGQRSPVTQAGLRQAWDKARAAAGVADLRWHDLRHDFATTLLRHADKSNLKTVQRALGHKSLAATKRYAHVNDADVAAAMGEAARNTQTPARVPQKAGAESENEVKSKGKLS